MRRALLPACGGRHTYLKETKMEVEFEFVTHSFKGKTYQIALNKAATDSYTQALRKEPRREPFLDYILARAGSLSRQIKVADFGANIGGISIPLAAHGVEVLAVEALPRNFLSLMVSTRANGFRNLTPINVAAYSGPSLVPLSGASAWAAIDKKAGGNSVIVAADTLASLLQTYRFDDADIIKLDIEGAELAALADVESLIARNQDLEIIYESNTSTSQAFGHDQQSLAARFEELGFRLYAFRGPGLMRLHARDAKPTHLLDILATRRTEAEILGGGHQIIPLTDKHLLDSLSHHAASGHKMLIAHVRAQEAYLSPAQKASAEWKQIASLLSSNTGEAVPENGAV
jgi:FkbM family methyltransferase